MSFFDRPFPNSAAISAYKIPSAFILSIVASASSVQVILLGNPGCTAGLMIPDDLLNFLSHLCCTSLVDRPFQFQCNFGEGNFIYNHPNN
jgi:hypothetical protein